MAQPGVKIGQPDMGGEKQKPVDERS